MMIRSTKLLFIYRSILFKFVKFQTDREELKNIVEALNKKNKKERRVEKKIYFATLYKLKKR